MILYPSPFRSSSQDYSDETAAKIDAEIHAIITNSYNNAKQILTDNIDKLHFIAKFLLKNEIMDGEQFTAAMEGNPTFEELEEMTEAKKRKSREENDRRRELEAAEERRKKEEAEKAAKTNSQSANGVEVEPVKLFDEESESNDEIIEEFPKEIELNDEIDENETSKSDEDENKED